MPDFDSMETHRTNVVEYVLERIITTQEVQDTDVKEEITNLIRCALNDYLKWWETPDEIAEQTGIDPRRTCRFCTHCDENSDGYHGTLDEGVKAICMEGGYSELSNIDRILSPEDCNAHILDPDLIEPIK